MSSEQRRRLASAAADAGYPASLLPAVAQATCRHTPQASSSLTRNSAT